VLHSTARHPGKLTTEETLKKLFEILGPAELETENKPIIDSLMMEAAVDIVSESDLPPFNRSAVDGYAVIAADTNLASPENPVSLDVVGQVWDGTEPGHAPKVLGGEAVLVSTGSPLPPEADAVVMVEQCERRGNVVVLTGGVANFQNVSLRGEDFQRGDIVVKRGTRLKPQHVAALAALGHATVMVSRPQRVGVLSTGSELVEVEAKPSPGKIVNSSKPLLVSLLKNLGCTPIDLGTVPDDFARIREKMIEGLNYSDILLTTGGSSVGEKDFVPRVVETLDEYTFVARGIRMRPGAATGVAIVRRKPIFILSGFAASAFVGFHALVRPCIQYLRGSAKELVPTVRGRLEKDVTNKPGVRSFVRVRVGLTRDGYIVEPLAVKGAGLLSTLTEANGILVLDESTPGYKKGTEVEVQVM